MEPFELNKIVDLQNILTPASEFHSSIAEKVDDQIKVVKNTANQMIKGYEMYGLENGLKTSQDFINNSVPGLNASMPNLSTPTVNKVLPLPELGSSLVDRLGHVGHEVPTVSGEATEQSDEESILPNTPHPQHSYKENSKRTLNRTGIENPELEY